jgi:hypothetical protein
MLALWDAGLWLLSLAFSVIDALTTPDLSADGPLAGVYPLTFAIGAAIAGVMAMVQVGLAALRRDGQSLGRVAIGLVQYGLVWGGYVGVAALLVTGVSGLTTGLLHGLLGVDSLSEFHPSMDVGRDVVDGTVATVLGISSVFLLVPASVGYLLLMLVREAALIVLAATSAISAGGLLAAGTSAWFWRSLRWFLAALFVSPVAVLVLGVGVKMTEGVITGANETSTEQAIGMAVVGCLLILLGAICPLVLFRLLAFVDAGTSSGAALRQSVAASGGVSGLLQRLGTRGAAAAAAASGGASVSGVAAQVAGGRARGESSADAATAGRFATVLAGLGGVASTVGRVATGAAASSVDLLSGAGIGHSAPFYTPSTSSRPGHRRQGRSPASRPHLPPSGTARGVTDMFDSPPSIAEPPPFWQAEQADPDELNRSAEDDGEGEPR